MGIRSAIGRVARTPRRRSREARRAATLERAVVFDAMERRQMFALLGIGGAIPMGFPQILTDQTGQIHYTYNPADSTGTFDLTATDGPPSAPTFFIDDGSILHRLVGPVQFVIQFKTDGAGSVNDGVAGADLTIRGAIDQNDNRAQDGSEPTVDLLKGEILQFGHQNNASTTDQFDFRFVPTSGTLLPAYGNRDAGVTVVAEQSNFTGTFTANFQSTRSKATAGPVAPLPAALGDYVWYDVNQDGVQDGGELGVPGVTVELFDAGSNLVGTQATNGSGKYLFTNLTPGSYSVKFSNLPAGFIFTSQNAGSDDAKDSDADTSTGKTGTYTLTSGQTNLTVDAGIYEPVLTPDPASLGDFVWHDLNANGVQDAGEPGINGVVINLKQGSTVLATTTTATNGSAQGWYEFGGLNAGGYIVEIDASNFTVGGALEGYFATPDNVGSPATDSNGSPTSTTLVAGQHDPTLDFGFYKKAAIGDFVWHDLNANGVQDAGEPGIDGVKVTLRDGGNNVVGTQFTTGGGGYLFTELVPGSYTVSFDTPPGYTPTGANAGADDAKDSDSVAGTTGSYTLASGETNLTVDAGFYKLAALGDFVWHDLNANGQQDAGEPGIAGVLVTLSNGATTTTDSNGFYLFSDLTPGTYSVTFATPAGYAAASPANVGNDATDSDAVSGVTGNYTLASGETNLTVDAGFYKLAALGDFVWHDLNANGVQDAGEPGIGGVLVTLSNGATTTTDSNGFYLFSDLTPGTYSVTFATPGGYVPTGANVGANDAVDSDAVSGTTGSYTLASGETNLTVDAGFYKKAALGDFVWHDKNANGQQDAGEPGIAGVLVTLSNGATTTTDSSGFYLFSDLTPGTYSVTFATPAGYAAASPANVGNDASDSDAVGGTTGNYTLASGETNLTVDAGFYKLAALGDFVWHDLNANGQQDAGEPGIGGVLVTLSNGATTTTDSNGYYLFSNLTPGSYSVTFATPSGYVATSANVGNDASDSDSVGGTTGSYTLASGETNLTVDAGFYKKAALGDFVWHDKNANGIQDAGEPGIGGVLVTLSNGATTTTDSNGYYLFSNLTPGTYSVTFATPAGYAAASPANAGANDAVDSDAVSGVTGNYTLASGETNLTVDAGFYKLAALGDFVWHDLNSNGIQDAGEPGIAGATVTLSNGAVTTTNASGFYLFSNLTPGTYSVTFTTPSGFTAASPANAGANDAVDSDAVSGVTGNYTLASGETNLTVDAGFYKLTPGIDVEKTTNGPSNSNPTAPDYDNEDAANGAGVPILTAGTAVTWTYKVTNTGNVPFTTSQITLVDDNGTPGNTADDMTLANGKITFQSVLTGDADNLLEPGEVWIYKATGTVQALVGSVSSTVTTFDFSGSSATSGTAGNVRPFTAGGISVNASAFSRDKSTGAWSTAWLGSYGGGLGVTDSSEGTGGSDQHTVDNSGRDNYVLFEFSQNIVLDSAFLGYVVGDSDLTVWIGTINNAFSSHVTLSDAVLSGLGFTEVNNTTLTSTRTADLNAGNVSGNVIVIAAKTGDSDDKFKIDQLAVRTATGGIYENKITLTVPGDTDSDLSHYVNPSAPKGSISGIKLLDKTGNGKTADDTPLGGVKIKLIQDLNNSGAIDAGDKVTTTVTAADGTWSFSNLAAGRYFVQEDLTGTDYVRTFPETSDTYTVNLTAGQNATGYTFVNYDAECDVSEFCNVYYIINGCKYYDLRGNTHQGDTITAYFTYTGSTVDQVSFVSYYAPSATFDANTAYLQQVYQQKTITVYPGKSYSIQITAPDCYYQVDLVCGPVIDQFGPAGSNIFYTPQKRLISADNGGCNACFCGTGTISGLAYVDEDDDGQVDADELGIKGVLVTLTGKNDLGQDVFATDYTDDDGEYVFTGLRPGTYKVTETQPTAYYDGKDTLGTVLGTSTTYGTAANDVFSGIVLKSGDDGINYNFGEKLKTTAVDNALGCDMTATIGFWQNKNGQALIRAMNGGGTAGTATKLGNWLATTFPNLFGATAPSGLNLAGKSNAQVADAFIQVFKTRGTKTAAQVLGTALAVYVTDSDLAGGTYASSYGFKVNTAGTGAATYNVGAYGSVLGLTNYKAYTISAILSAANTKNVLNSTSSSVQTSVNNLFSNINEIGDI